MEANWKFSETELHIFIPDEHNVQKSVDIFIAMYNSRSRANREFWILDQNPFKNEDINEVLKELVVDLDDDLYTVITSDKNQVIEINEVYKIRPTFDFIILPYGSFNNQLGLQLSSLEKWTRRKDLRVSNIISEKKVGLFRTSLLGSVARGLHPRIFPIH